jgi:hypothetical protein
MSGDDNFISRWSKRKLAARSGKPIAEAGADRPPATVVPAQAGTQVAQPTQESVPLPPVESLTPESDFTAFMKPDVDPGLRRDALKVLVRDPRFNVMDGLDVYIDDYSKPDPLPPEWLGQLNQMKRLGAYLEEPEKTEKDASADAVSALQKPMQEQPVADEPADTAREDSNEVSVTESAKSGGKLPRNEA